MYCINDKKIVKDVISEFGYKGLPNLVADKHIIIQIILYKNNTWELMLTNNITNMIESFLYDKGIWTSMGSCATY